MSRLSVQTLTCTWCGPQRELHPLQAVRHQGAPVNAETA